MDLHDPALTVALALAAGIIAQSLALHLRIPGIVLLLAAGVLLGPDVAGLVQPEALGDGLHMIVGLAVAVILFEGGLNLNVRRLRHEAFTIRRLITVGALVTGVGGAVFARVFMGWDWRLAALFGSLVTVTGPTVITPILRRIRLKRKVATILEAEGVLIDPIGAILAVVVLEVIVESGVMGTAVGLLGLPYRLGLGTLLGIGGGLLIGLLLRYEEVVPEGLENVFTLALVLALFEASETVLSESGILTVAVAGMVVGNMETRVQQELMEFKEQLTILLVGLLFVLLAADVRIERVLGLGWTGAATVTALILIVRPLDVAVSTAGSSLETRERLFLCWLAPRGIVAAAVSSLFAQRLELEAATGTEALVAGAEELVALVFLVIAVTVVLQGGTAGWVASLLGLRRPEEHGHVLVGANAVGRALADALRGGGEEVVLIDTNATEARAAEEQGFRVVYGNANEERTLLQADVGARRSFIAVTPNEAVNLLLARKARDRFRAPRAYVVLKHRKLGVQEGQVREADARVLFGVAVDIERWNHLFLQGGGAVERWRYDGAERRKPMPDVGEAPGPEEYSLLPLAIVSGGVAYPADDEIELRRGDILHLARVPELADAIGHWLGQAGLVPLDGEDTRRESPGSATGT